VAEVTLDMAGNMELICKRCFPQATRVTDRFHVQKLATEALQEMRVKYRWEAMDVENEAIEQSKDWSSISSGSTSQWRYHQAIAGPQ